MTDIVDARLKRLRTGFSVNLLGGIGSEKTMPVGVDIFARLIEQASSRCSGY
jgi:hypothetical protein